MAGKHVTIKKRHWAPFVVILAVAALVAAIGGTMAWLTASHDGITNTFTPAKIYAEVKETFNETSKTNVRVFNGYTNDNGNPVASDVPAYIRVALVPTWEDAQGNAVAHSASLDDLIITWGTDGWYTDGHYYYYTSAVAAGSDTKNLIVSASVNEESDGYIAGYHMNLQILAQAIQADGVGTSSDNTVEKPVKLAWGIDPTEQTPNLKND